MTKTIYGKFHSVPCKFIITEEQIAEAYEAMEYLKACKWTGYLAISIKPNKVYHENKQDLLYDIDAFIYVDKETMSLCYDGYEGIEYMTEMHSIPNLSDIWASESFLEGLTNRDGYGKIDKRLLLKEDKENLRHLTIMYKLEESK